MHNFRRILARKHDDFQIISLAFSAQNLIEIFFFCENGCSDQDCGVGVEDGIGVGQGRPFCPELDSELESANLADYAYGPESRAVCCRKTIIVTER